MADNKNSTPQQGESVAPCVVEVDVPLSPLDQIQVGKWEIGLFGCMKDCVPNCCMVSFCPCVSLAQISARLGMSSYMLALTVVLLLLVFTCGVGHIVVFVWIWKARALTRERFQISGSCCGDCCASLCFPCCTLAQTDTHIKSYKAGSCDFGPQDTLPAYNRSQVLSSTWTPPPSADDATTTTSQLRAPDNLFGPCGFHPFLGEQRGLAKVRGGGETCNALNPRLVFRAWFLY